MPLTLHTDADVRTVEEASLKLALISCEVFYREMCSVIARSPHQVDVTFLPKGLHDLGAPEMRLRVQEHIDGIDATGYEAILLGFGLCNNGLNQLRAPDIPLVLPRAHDCITLFLGCRKRYLEYFHANPGVYFKTSGWIERGEVNGELKQLSVQHRFGMDQSYPELVEKYGEDNARYLYDTLCNTEKNYGRITFIEMGVEPDDRFERQARRDAEERGWGFEKLKGDLALFEALVGGRWSPQHFLVVQPGEEVATSHDEDIVRAVPRPGASESR